MELEIAAQSKATVMKAASNSTEASIRWARPGTSTTRFADKRSSPDNSDRAAAETVRLAGKNTADVLNETCTHEPKYRANESGHDA